MSDNVLIVNPRISKQGLYRRGFCVLGMRIWAISCVMQTGMVTMSLGFWRFEGHAWIRWARGPLLNRSDFCGFLSHQDAAVVGAVLSGDPLAVRGLPNRCLDPVITAMRIRVWPQLGHRIGAASSPSSCEVSRSGSGCSGPL